MKTLSDVRQKLFAKFTACLDAGDQVGAKQAMKELFLEPLTSVERGEVYFSLMTAYMNVMAKADGAYEKVLDGMIERLDLIEKREGEIGEENQKAAARQTISEQ